MTRRPSRPEQEAERVIQQARLELTSLGEPWDSYQVDVELLATLLFGLGVQRVADLRAGEREYAGFLDAEARLVAVEETHHAHRQRFSIAHEVGHFVLHYLPRPDGGSVFYCTSSDMEVGEALQGSGARSQHLRQEAEANLFAGALLMPEQPLQAMYKVTGGRVLALARHFKVSAKAMEIRLTQLELPFIPVR